MKEKQSVRILLAEDDEDDFLLIKKAFASARINNDLIRVKDGVELIAYLHRTGDFKNPKKSPRPCLILIDLNMPRKDGRESLKEIKSNDDLKTIPIVVLTTSKSDEDVLKSYNLGANSFVTKPVKMDELIRTVDKITEYWLELVQLPKINGG